MGGKSHFLLEESVFFFICFIHQNFLILVITFIPCPQLGSPMRRKDEMFKYKLNIVNLY